MIAEHSRRPGGARRLRICMISREFPPGDNVGGVGRATSTLASGLARRGHDVTVVAQAQTRVGSGIDDGVQVLRWRLDERPATVYYRMRPGRRWDVAHRIALSDLAFRVASKKAKDDGAPYDVIDTWLWGSEAYRYTSYRGLGKLIVRLSSPDFELRDQEGRQPRPDLDALDQRCLDSAHVVAGLTHENVERTSRYFRIDDRKVVMTPLGIPVIDEPVDRARVRDSREILYVGRLEARKGTQEFIDALPHILTADPTYTATLIGSATGTADDGRPFDQYLADVVPAVLRARIDVRGRVPDAELCEAYRRSALAVFPSRYESFGLVVLEALVHGIPVVASRVGGIPEVMDERMGRLVNPGDATELAHAVVDMMADDDGRARAGTAGAEHVRLHFTVDHMVDRALDAYGTALATGDRS